MIYIYKAELIRVVDGDTVELMIDQGFSDFTEQKMRLYGIDSPEMRTNAGKALTIKACGSVDRGAKEKAIPRQVRAVSCDYLRRKAREPKRDNQRAKDPGGRSDVAQRSAHQRWAG
jgi:endonuclease YncB( thermonuclease family)